MTTPDPIAAARAAGRAEMLPQLLAAEVRAASGGRITAEQAAGIVEPLQASYFLGEDGTTLDQAKISTYIAPLLDSAGPAAPAGFPGLGQGGSSGPTSSPVGAAGRAEAQRRFGDDR